MQPRSSTQSLAQLVSTGTSKYIPTDTNCYENDHLYNMLSDLVNPAFKPWYCKMFYSLGKDTVLRLASEARADGKDRRKYFSVLLKRAK